ncbi:hypothetical protein EMCRGX_G007193 [Ephydatia muelleri]
MIYVSKRIPTKLMGAILKDKARLPVEADLRPIPSNYDSRLAHAPNTSNQMAQSVHTQSLRSFLTPSLESVIIPTFQSAFAHSLQSVYTTAFQSTSAHSLQSVYTTAFQSVYTTAFQSVYTTAFQQSTPQHASQLSTIYSSQSLPKSPHQSSSHLSKVISSTISSASGCPSKIIQVPFSCDDNETECSGVLQMEEIDCCILWEQLHSSHLMRLWRTGACVLHYKAAEDDEEFDVSVN